MPPECDSNFHLVPNSPNLLQTLLHDAKFPLFYHPLQDIAERLVFGFLILYSFKQFLSFR